MAETINVSVLADKISEELFSFLKWELLPRRNENFTCNKKTDHKTSTKEKNTHPVDCVFTYIDPYFKKRIFIHTDLKSYAKSSIKPSEIRKDLNSLAYSIDCAKSSPEWDTLYGKSDYPKEIRGLLFIYNHDNTYDRDFLTHFNPEQGRGIKLENLGIAENQFLHIIYPSIINYLLTIKLDTDSLHRKGEFPSSEYYFYYPELILTKPILPKENRPASIEMALGPFLTIEHDEIVKYCEKEKKLITMFGKGYIIYYNRPASSHYEFIYLLDILSKEQILEGEHTIRIRIAHENYDQNYKENFQKAITSYALNWGLDQYKINQMERIDIDVVEVKQKSFCQSKVSRDE